MTTQRTLLYGAGQLGMMALTRYFFQWVLKFAGTSDAAGIVLFSTASVGLLFLAFRIFDGVTDPLAGALSDGMVKRGRPRQSLLWLSFALPPIGLALVFSPAAEMASSLRWALLCLGMLIFFVGYTLYAIPYWSLIEDYSQGDQKARTRLSNTLGIGVLAATGVGFVLSPMLVESLGYLGGAIVWAIPCTLLMLLPIAAAPKKTAATPPPAAREASQALSKSSWKRAFSDRSFIALILLFGAAQMSFTVITAAAPFIAVDLLGGKTSHVALLLGPFLLSALLTFAFVPRLGARLGIERAMLVAALLLGIVYGCSGFLGVSVIVSPLVTAMCLFAAAGPMAAVILGLEGEAVAAAAARQPDKVVSLYFGVLNLIVKALNGLALYLTGILAARVPSLGAEAVRPMSFLAGSLLVLGVATYSAVRKRQSQPAT